MNLTVNLEDAAHDLRHWAEAAHSGTEVAILKDGLPYALLLPPRPAAPVPQRRAGRLSSKVDDAFFEPLDD
jgi:antitoxin (DNA-binding transcriptional repressor) of toxin-antitoxin stability system